MLRRPDDRTTQALRRLRVDADFHEFMAWIEHSLNELDHASRSTMDAVTLRQQQGASQALAEIVARAQGRDPARAIAAKATPVADGL